MEQEARRQRRSHEPVERVDPFDLGDVSLLGVAQTAREAAGVRLEELRSRITELDAEVAGLLARREQLTRAAFELAGGTGGVRLRDAG